jgi:hypothetical protein
MGRSRPVSGLSEPRRKPTLAPPHPGRSRPCGRTPCTGSAASASSLGGSRSKLAKAGWPTHGHPVTAQIVVRDDARVWSMRQHRIWSRLARISVSGITYALARAGLESPASTTISATATLRRSADGESNYICGSNGRAAAAHSRAHAEIGPSSHRHAGCQQRREFQSVLALAGRVVRSRAPRKAEAYLLPVRKSDVGGTWLVDDTCLGFLLDVREAAGRPEARRLVARRLVARRTLARRPAAWRPAGECACGIRGRSDPRRRRNVGRGAGSDTGGRRDASARTGARSDTRRRRDESAAAPTDTAPADTGRRSA